MRKTIQPQLCRFVRERPVHKEAFAADFDFWSIFVSRQKGLAPRQ